MFKMRLIAHTHINMYMYRETNRQTRRELAGRALYTRGMKKLPLANRIIENAQTRSMNSLLRTLER